MAGGDADIRATEGIPGLADYLRVLPQYLLPQRTLSSLMHRVARFRLPIWKNLKIQWFVRHYGVDMSLAAEPNLQNYPHFNAFFTRQLRADARPFPADARNMGAPADGRLVAFGDVDDTRLLQAKGHDYTLEDLLGGSRERTEMFRGGSFATIYLSPRDYHRVHMPFGGRLTEMVYVPGRLFSVNASTARLVPRIFARNERVIALFDTTLGPMAVILVGAIFVGSIETVWAGRLTPPYGHAIRTWHYPPSGQDTVALQRGAEMGRFNVGSTVILLLPRGKVEWLDGLSAGQAVLTGESLCRTLG